jgi:hypothetical protein
VELNNEILPFQHSMVYFFHHYELPAILQQARIQQIVNNQQNNQTNQDRENNQQTNQPENTTQTNQPEQNQEAAGQQLDDANTNELVQNLFLYHSSEHTVD